ncbi:hypothetical protein [Streptomyces sp. NBC_00467]|uniref:hypothetical protein n=1 Tax=Streptomyces sp. NBC_00467 TaxID=2975752 RepID=UPI002E19BEBC
MLVVAVGTGCRQESGAPQHGATQRADALTPLTKAQLADALPEDGELNGFTTKTQASILLEAQDVVSVDEAACRPIADMMSVRPRHPRKAMVWATLKPDEAPPEASPGSVVLSSHAVEDAVAWMAELKEALTDCAEFTAVSQRGWTFRFIVQSLPATKAGDDSATYVLTNTAVGAQGGNTMTVVRTGAVFATYLMNEVAGKPNPIPAEAAQQQHRKLQAALKQS